MSGTPSWTGHGREAVEVPPPPRPGTEPWTELAEEGGEGKPMDRLSLCEYNLGLAMDFVKMADHKARFLMRLALGLFGATFIGLPPSMSVLKTYLEEGATNPVSLALFVTVVMLYGVCAACLTVSLMKIISVVRPRLLSGETDEPSPLFFQSVAQMGRDRVHQMLSEMSEERAIRELSTQIYHNSVVAERKYRKLGEAINWMLGGGLFAVVFALLVIVSAKLF